MAQTSTKATIAMHYLEGTVCDELGEPLPGAKVTVLMKDDEKNVTVTDQHGHFHLATNDKELAIIVSFVGYKDARQVVKAGKRKYDFSLQPNEAMMNEVAITGYNIIDKRRLTSAISSVTKEDLDFKGALTVDQMLEGKVAGLLTMTQSTTPGAAPKMRLRGSTTFTGSREPLWVIDGVVYENPVPVSADDINSLDNINLIGNAISGLNPQDIERIDVLKDASATAIYGTRAANGVIVVTTKSGQEGKPSINYAFNAQVTQRPHYSDFNLMTSKERIDVSREIMEKGLFFERVPERYGYEGAMMDYWDKNITYEQFQQTVGQLESNNTDWFGALYRNAFSQAHNVSISGGGSGTRYYASVGYDSDKGAERGTDLQRFTARMNLTTHIGENVTMDLRLSGSQQDAHYNSPYYSAFDEAYYTNRIFPAYNADGSFAYISKRIKEDQSTGQNVYGNYNVLHEYANSGQDIKNKSLNLTGTLNWEIIEGLRYTTTLGYTSTSNNTENWMGDNTFYCAQLRGYADEMPRADAFMQSVLQDGGIWSGSAIDQKSYLWRNQFNYHFDIHNIHQFNFDLGHEVTSTQYRGHNTGQVPGYSPEQGESFIPVWAGSAVDAQQYYWYLRQWFMGADTNPTAFPTITAKKNNKLSFYLTATYTFRNYFSLNFNARNDGSNQFGQYERAKFNPVWSASGRVNLHELAALKDVEWLNSLALRGSYGYRGSVPSATPYLIMTTPRKSSVSGEFSASIHDYPNANLEWEKTSTWNLGLEASMLKDRINLGVDFYHSRSTDLISNRSVSLVNGTTSLFFNDGEATNTGVELTLNTLNIKTKDFRWRTSLIYSYNKNHVKRGIISTNTYADYINGTVILDGMSVDGFYSYRFDGLDRYGLPTFKGLIGNESGLSRDAFLQRLLTYSGTRTPRSYGSFSTEFSWRGVSLRAQFSYKFGYKQRLLALYEDGVSALPQPEDNMRGDFVHRWRTPGDEQHTSIPALTNASLNYRSNSTLTSYDDHYIDIDSQYATYSGPASYTGWYMYNNSDERVVNASHIRFRSLTLGYDLPKAWISKLKLTNCRIDFQAQNLCVWTFDKKLKGQDPDQVASIGMPVLPTFNFGIQVGF
ncbi:MAG: SusC/RagA family TonB-linked outer membrane protein [Bacteroidales bacterium]|nr:SusC/RagA family TonB-linked outer membrane protein [Candidatus Physcousia equi]